MKRATLESPVHFICDKKKQSRLSSYHVESIPSKKSNLSYPPYPVKSIPSNKKLSCLSCYLVKKSNLSYPLILSKVSRRKSYPVISSKIKKPRSSSRLCIILYLCQIILRVLLTRLRSIQKHR